MPREFRICGEVDQEGDTNLEILSGEKTLFPRDRLISNSLVSATDSQRLIMAVLQKKEFAGPWTKPSAIEMSEESVPYDRLRVIGQRYRNEVDSLLTLGGSILKAGPKPGVEIDRRIYRQDEPLGHKIYIPKVR